MGPEEDPGASEVGAVPAAAGFTAGDLPGASAVPGLGTPPDKPDVALLSRSSQSSTTTRQEQGLPIQRTGLARTDLAFHTHFT